MRYFVARAHTEHRFTAVLFRLRVAGTLRVSSFIAKDRNAGEEFGFFGFRKFVPLDAAIIRIGQAAPRCWYTALRLSMI